MNTTFIKEYELSYSLPLFFIKNHFKIINTKLICNPPSILNFFPVKCKNDVLSLSAISSATVNKKLSAKDFILGIMCLFSAIINTNLNIVLPLFGALLLLSCFKLQLNIITKNRRYVYRISPIEKRRLKEMIEIINKN